MQAADLLRVGHLRAVNMPARRSFRGVSTDSRTVKPGELFFALRGEKFDGHAFLDAVFGRGAACAVVDKAAPPGAWTSKPHLVVADTTVALGELATIWRRKFDIPVVAVGGSNGKTTTKEMIAAVLRSRYRVLSTEGNLNNRIGVPQTLFRLKPQHEAAVVEVGTNHFGEIAELTKLLEPTHGLLTNIGREHLEFFGGLDGVARAEGELFDNMPRAGVAFVNADDARIAALAKRMKRRITYGFDKSHAVRGRIARIGADGCAEMAVTPRGGRPFGVKLAVPGTHAAANALAAAAVGLTLGVPRKGIARALARFEAVGKRMEVVEAGGVVILNDTYNANPDSVLAALATLAAMKAAGKKVVILADMLELGAASEAEHARIGGEIGSYGARHLLTYGAAARSISGHAHVDESRHFDDKNALAAYAAGLLAPGDVVLVKGSRGMGMETVVAHIKSQLEKR